MSNSQESTSPLLSGNVFHQQRRCWKTSSSLVCLVSRQHTTSHTITGLSTKRAPADVKPRASSDLLVPLPTTTQRSLDENTAVYFKYNPFDLKNAYTQKPIFPIDIRNLRIIGVSGRQRRVKGRKYRDGKRVKRRMDKKKKRHLHVTQVGSMTPFYKKFPSWRAAGRSWHKQPTLDWVSLSKLKSFLERGRVDHRFPITQRHMNDSKMVRVKQGVMLYSSNERPFPFRVHVEITSADQLSIDAINAVGGSVTVVYRNHVNLMAHIHPERYEILPKATEPDLNAIFALEKLRARGCIVNYIKPLWLIQEEEIMKAELSSRAADRMAQRGEFVKKEKEHDSWTEQLLARYRVKSTPRSRTALRRSLKKQFNSRQTS